MSRKEKLHWLLFSAADLYFCVTVITPDIINNPDTATYEDIALYNQYVSLVLKKRDYSEEIINSILF